VQIPVFVSEGYMLITRTRTASAVLVAQAIIQTQTLHTGTLARGMQLHAPFDQSL
jgi:hypothetical protein